MTDSKKPVFTQTIEAIVENKPQPLRKIRPFHTATKQVPSSLPSEAKIVLMALFDCFDKQKSVKEGLVDDLVWGFKQARLPSQLTANGLMQLMKLGYIKFQAPDGGYIDFASDRIKRAWIRYQPKLLEMVYEDPTS